MHALLRALAPGPRGGGGDGAAACADMEHIPGSLTRGGGTRLSLDYCLSLGFTAPFRGKITKREGDKGPN